MHARRVGDALRHGHARVQRGVAVLEHHLHLPAHGVHRDAVAVADRIAVEHHVAGVGLDQPHQQPRGGGLAAAGFADDAEGLALADGEGDVVHRLHGRDLAVQQAAAHREVLAQVVRPAAVAARGRRGRADQP